MTKCWLIDCRDLIINIVLDELVKLIKLNGTHYKHKVAATYISVARHGITTKQPY